MRLITMAQKFGKKMTSFLLAAINGRVRTSFKNKLSTLLKTINTWAVIILDYAAIDNH
jgi:hypothetical protein